MSQADPDPTPRNPYLPGPPQAEPDAGPPTQPLHPFPAAPRPGPPYPAAPSPSPAPGAPYAGPPAPWGPGGVPWSSPPEHPQATTALVLGVVAIMGFLPVGPFAWVIGGRARRAIDADPARWGGRGLATAGWALGIATTAILGFFLAFLALVIGLAAGG